MGTTRAILGALGAIVIAGISAANAVQISGTIGFTSAPNTPAGTVSQASGTTSIDFNNPMFVNFGTDNYASTVGQPVTFTDFSFTGSGNHASLVGTVVPEWTFTMGSSTFSFDLLNLTAGTFSKGPLSALTVQGQGIAHMTGFQDTNATFSLSGVGNRFTFTILQSENIAQPVPDGGSAVALLGLGLVAVEAVRRKLTAS